MANNITTNDLANTNDLSQSLLLNYYVHNKIRVPLEVLFNQGQSVNDEQSTLELNFNQMDLKTNNSDVENVWSIKIKPILDQIVFLSESTKQKTIGFIGDAGAGKSSLINSILQYDLLPTNYDETCTASVSAISSWNKSYYQLFVYFISEEQWQIESKDARDTVNIFKANNETELPDDVKAFQSKQKYLYNSESVDTAPLDSLPENVKEKMIKGYELLETEDLEILKEKLNTFASLSGNLWPIVYKIYIRGPFKKLSSDIILLDIPGYNDGFEEMTVRAAEAAATCDQLVQVVRGDGRSPFTPTFLTGLLKSSILLKHFSLVITHRNAVEKQKAKEKVNNQPLEEQCKEKLRKIASNIAREKFSSEYIHEFINGLPLYYLENKCEDVNWSKNEEYYLNKFINDQFNNVVGTELDQTRLDAINNINILLKSLSSELSQPLNEMIPSAEIEPLIFPCLSAFSTKTDCLKLYSENGCKKLWDEYFWPLLQKINPAISVNEYNGMNYQTLRKNLTGIDYTWISSDLASGVINESKIKTLPTAESVLTEIFQIDDLQVIFSENLFLPLKDIFQPKIDERLSNVIDTYADRVKYFIDNFSTSIDDKLKSVRGLVKHMMNAEMSAQIRERLWIGDKLNRVSGLGTKNRYLDSLHEFIRKLNTTDLNFSEQLYNRLSYYFQGISDDFTRFTEDINKTVTNINFTYALDTEIKNKVLQVLTQLPSQFTSTDKDTSDCLLEKNSVTSQDKVLPENNETMVLNKQWTLSNIHAFNNEVLAPIPRTYTNISTDRIYNGYVYVLSNEAMPNIYKIGYTTVTPDFRAKKLYTTGVPLPFSIEKYYRCQNCRLFEQWMHKLFKKHRLNNRREFFQVPLQIIINVGDQLEIIMKEEYRNG